MTEGSISVSELKQELLLFLGDRTRPRREKLRVLEEMQDEINTLVEGLRDDYECLVE